MLIKVKEVIFTHFQSSLFSLSSITQYMYRSLQHCHDHNLHLQTVKTNVLIAWEQKKISENHAFGKSCPPLIARNRENSNL